MFRDQDPAFFGSVPTLFERRPSLGNATADLHAVLGLQPNSGQSHGDRRPHAPHVLTAPFIAWGAGDWSN